MKLENVIKQVSIYEKEFRNANRTSFLISRKYNLFPDAEHDVDCWPHEYPYGNKAGVYLILDKDENLLYIGKSSKKIGGRLSSYFRYAKNKQCELIHSGWTSDPKYVVTIAMEDNAPFECASLEEYLLFIVGTTDNYNLSKK